MTWEVKQGHVLETLRAMPDESVQMVVTSPPYFGLRSYSTDPQVWGGCPEHHTHEWGEPIKPGHYNWQEKIVADGKISKDHQKVADAQRSHSCVGHEHEWGEELRLDKRHVWKPGAAHERVNGRFCPCGAWKGELGAEPTVDMFVEHLVEILREVRRVLRKDGTVWLNIGDSYSGSGKGPTGWNGIGDQGKRQGFIGTKRGPNSQLLDRSVADYQRSAGRVHGLKPKDLCLIPYRLAIALQDDGWWVRSIIAWCKTSAMPESVQDRPTSAWEPILLLSKGEHYYYDHVAVREPFKAPEGPWGGRNPRPGVDANGGGQGSSDGFRDYLQNGGANLLRNYWLLGPGPFHGVHTAVFPTEIPRRAILAGSSAYGACAECGSPWRRVVSRRKHPTRDVEAQRAAAREKTGRTDGHVPGPSGMVDETETTGWEPSCQCPPGTDFEPDAVERDLRERAGVPLNVLYRTRPCVVLDPFLGSGTTCIVAERLGRDSIGIELNPEYAAMSRKRLIDTQPSMGLVL